jgi:hypothetical protein
MHHDGLRQTRQHAREAEIRKLRRLEAETAARRRAELDVAEQERRALVRDQLTQRHNEESRLMLLAFGAIAVFIVAVVLYVVITLLF